MVGRSRSFAISQYQQGCKGHSQYEGQEWPEGLLGDEERGGSKTRAQLVAAEEKRRCRMEEAAVSAEGGEKEGRLVDSAG